MNFASRSKWKSPAVLRPRRLPAGVRGWLLDRGSLTARLQMRCPARFRVELLHQRRERPRIDESRLLGIPPGCHALVREVRLYCGHDAWVFARTVIPLASLRGRNRRLGSLGERPLGAFLFSHPGLRRGRFELGCLKPGDPLFRRALDGETAVEGVDAVWGRRSVFWLHGQPLLVAEFFLPDLLRAWPG